jgi:MYXO-CTERM domain-containing protein
MSIREAVAAGVGTLAVVTFIVAGSATGLVEAKLAHESLCDVAVAGSDAGFALALVAVAIAWTTRWKRRA